MLYVSYTIDNYTINIILLIYVCVSVNPKYVNCWKWRVIAVERWSDTLNCNEILLQ